MSSEKRNVIKDLGSTESVRRRRDKRLSEEVERGRKEVVSLPKVDSSF